MTLRGTPNNAVAPGQRGGNMTTRRCLAILLTVGFALSRPLLSSELLIPIEQLVRESDAIVIATLSNPARAEGPASGTRIWTAALRVHEVLLGDVDPAHPLQIQWLEFEPTDDFNRHYERMRGKKRLWLLIADKNAYYSAQESGRCLPVQEKQRVQDLVQRLQNKQDLANPNPQPDNHLPQMNARLTSRFSGPVSQWARLPRAIDTLVAYVRTGR